MEDYLTAAKKYAKRYLSNTEDYKSNKDNDYYYITVFTKHLVKKSLKNKKFQRQVKKILKNNGCVDKGNWNNRLA